MGGQEGTHEEETIKESENLVKHLKLNELAIYRY